MLTLDLSTICLLVYRLNIRWMSSFLEVQKEQVAQVKREISHVIMSDLLLLVLRCTRNTDVLGHVNTSYWIISSNTHINSSFGISNNKDYDHLQKFCPCKCCNCKSKKSEWTESCSTGCQLILWSSCSPAANSSRCIVETHSSWDKTHGQKSSNLSLPTCLPRARVLCHVLSVISECPFQKEISSPAHGSMEPVALSALLRLIVLSDRHKTLKASLKII